MADTKHTDLWIDIIYRWSVEYDVAAEGRHNERDGDNTKIVNMAARIASDEGVELNVQDAGPAWGYQIEFSSEDSNGVIHVMSAQAKLLTYMRRFKHVSITPFNFKSLIGMRQQQAFDRIRSMDLHPRTVYLHSLQTQDLKLDRLNIKMDKHNGTVIDVYWG